MVKLNINTFKKLKNVKFLMIKARFSYAVLILFLIVLSSCSTSKFNSSLFINNHPNYDPEYLSGSKIYTQSVDVDNFFTLIGYRMSRDFELDRAELNIHFAPKFDNWFQNAFSEITPTTAFSLNSIKSQTNAEKFQISDKVFINVNLPMQGKIVKFDEKSPKTILFLNEITLGANLKPEYLYDYEISNKDERPEVKESDKELSLVTSYVLWDNQKQRVLQASVISANIPMPTKLSEKHLEELVKITINTLVDQLDIKKQGSAK